MLYVLYTRGLFSSVANFPRMESMRFHGSFHHSTRREPTWNCTKFDQETQLR